MLTVEMLALLRCPSCESGTLEAEITDRRGERIEEGALVCRSCQASHPVRGGVPDLVPRGILSAPEWQLWIDHLEAFQERREMRVVERDRLVSRVARHARRPGGRRPGSEFVSITRGALLDVGCGPGSFRLRCDEREITYYGLDPHPLPQVADFRYVRALAEYIPFHDDTFSHVVVRAALDHFQDVESFFQETVRVLVPGGMLHIAQSVHDVTGPVTAVKALLHWTKDVLEDRLTGARASDAPHHMAEFKRSSLYEALEAHFEIAAEQRVSRRWYTPDHLHLSLVPHSKTESPRSRARRAPPSFRPPPTVRS